MVQLAGAGLPLSTITYRPHNMLAAGPRVQQDRDSSETAMAESETDASA